MSPLLCRSPVFSPSSWVEEARGWGRDKQQEIDTSCRKALEWVWSFPGLLGRGASGAGESCSRLGDSVTSNG